MAVAAKQTRQDPLIKKEISGRFREVVELSGLDPAVISFRCGWKARTRITNYMNGERTPGAQELMQLDKVLLPVLGKYVSNYILHGDGEKIQENGELTLAAVNRAFTYLINDYVEMGRLVAEPKLTTSRMLDDFNDVYLKREMVSGNPQ